MAEGAIDSLLIVLRAADCQDIGSHHCYDLRTTFMVHEKKVYMQPRNALTEEYT